MKIAFHQVGDHIEVSINGQFVTEGQANMLIEDLNSPSLNAAIVEQWQARLDKIAKDFEESGFGDISTLQPKGGGE